MQNFGILTILGLAMVAILHYRKSKFCRGHRFSNSVNVIILIQDVQKLYTDKTIQNRRQYTFIQNYRHAKS